MNYKSLLTDNKEKLDMNTIYMNLALMLSTRSTCKSGSAGCVIVRNGRIISTGYNGSPSKAIHCKDRESECRSKGSLVRVAFNTYRQPFDYEVKTEGCFDSIHAEQNAISYCARNGIATDGAELYVSCPVC